MPTPTNMTGRPGHPFAKLAMIRLGFNLPQQPVRPPRPRPDMATTVTLGWDTSVALFAHSSSIEIGERVTSVTPDE